MTDNHKKENALILTSSKGLARIDNSVKLTNKILSQGALMENDYSKIKFIPFSRHEFCYFNLLDIVNKKIIENLNHYVYLWNEYSNRSFWISRIDDYEYYITDSYSGEKKYFGNFYSIQIVGNYILTLDKDKKVKLYNKTNKLICEIPIKIERYLFFDILDDKYIEIHKFYDETSKYLYFFDFNGKNINLENIDQFQKEKERILSKTINIKDTLWAIKEDGLYFNNDIRRKLDNDEFKLKVGNFYAGYAFVWFETMYVELQIDLGFIDVYGNCFF